MLRQFVQKVYSSLVKDPGAAVVDADRRAEYLENARNVRAVDYVAKFEVKNGAASMRSLVTRANWRFIMTGAAVFWESFDPSNMPKVSVSFDAFAPSSPFRNTDKGELNAVPCSLVFGREGLTGIKNHFEEYKNLFYVLDQRFSITLDAVANAGQYGRGYVLLTGVEVNLGTV